MKHSTSKIFIKAKDRELLGRCLNLHFLPDTNFYYQILLNNEIRKITKAFVTDISGFAA